MAVLAKIAEMPEPDRVIAVWPTAYALKELTPAVEAKIGELMKRATS